MKRWSLVVVTTETEPLKQGEMAVEIALLKRDEVVLGV